MKVNHATSEITLDDGESIIVIPPSGDFCLYVFWNGRVEEDEWPQPARLANKEKN